MPPIVATLATNECYDDLKLFLSSLSLWYSKADAPTVYIYADSQVAEKIIAEEYHMHIVFCQRLDDYSGLTRQEMEAVSRPNNTTLWYEFQMEKLNLLDWVFESDAETATRDGVFYLDSDICFFGPLPTPPPTMTVGLSPHYIRPRDEARFGRYNGGFLWFKEQRAVKAWRDACPNSRFHEQAAIECFDEASWSDKVYMFPPQVNYGWWRMFQGSYTASELQAKWSAAATIIVDGQPLQSIHTHFYKPGERATLLFNEFVIKKLKAISTPQAKKLLQLIKFE